MMVTVHPMKIPGRWRDGYALAVEVQGTLGRLHGVLAGRNQASATAAAAAATVRILLESDVVHPGAWLAEEVLEPDAFFSRLAAAGLTIRFEEAQAEACPTPVSSHVPELSPRAPNAEAAMSSRTRGGP